MATTAPIQDNTVSAKLQQTFRVYLILAAFVLGMGLLTVGLIADKKMEYAPILFGSLFLLIAGFFVALIKYAADKVELQLTPNGLREISGVSGQSREIYFDDFQDFGFMTDGRGNYYIRIRQKSGGPVIKYYPRGIRMKFRTPFIEFGGIMETAVARFNREKVGATSPSHQPATKDELLPMTASRSGNDSTSTVAMPIKTGLNKSEKTLNWFVKILRVVWLIFILISGLVYIFTTDNPGRTFLYVLLGCAALYGAYLLIQRNKKKS